MVRVSWPPDIAIACDNESSNNADKPIERQSSLPTASSTPSSSNTPTSATSPSLSPPLTCSPASTASPSPQTTTPAGEGTSLDSSLRKNSRGSLEQTLLKKTLIEEFKGDFWALRSESNKDNTEMLPLGELGVKYVDEDSNNNNNKNNEENDEERTKQSRRVSIREPVPTSLPLEKKDDLLIKDPMKSSLKTMKCPNVPPSPIDDGLFSRMIATFSDFEDDFETIDGVEIESDSEPDELEQMKQLLADKWRLLFDKFDCEGFGEIPWPDFRRALIHPEFVAAVDVHRREQLAVKALAAKTSAITFQDFANVMSGKRTRSFKCAVHQRDREVSSENDFHLLLQDPPLFDRMVRLIADEFLTEERDRKYYADHYRCWPPPVFILCVTLVQLSVFCYYTLITGEMEWGGPVPLDSPFIYRPDKRQHVWRFLFYALLHAGWVHLVFNLMVQLLVGLPLEMVHGSARIGTVYLAGVVAGSLGTSVFDSEVFLVGASGGVYALLAAHLANVLINYHSMQFGILRLLGVLFVASADVGYAIYDRYAHVSMGLPVSYVAHLTGALAGLTLGLVVLKNFEQRLHEQLLWWVALGIYIACTIFAILFNIFHPYPYEGVAQAMFL